MKAAEMKKGQTIVMDGRLYIIIEFEHVKCGKGGAIYQTKLKSVTDGLINNARIRSEENIEEVTLDKRKYEYLYSEPGGHILMDIETFDQITLDNDAFGDGKKFLKPNTEIAKSSGTENIGPERPLSGRLEPGAVLSSSHITLENNGRIPPQPVRQNGFMTATGGGDGPEVEPSLPVRH